MVGGFGSVSAARILPLSPIPAGGMGISAPNVRFLCHNLNHTKLWVLGKVVFTGLVNIGYSHWANQELGGRKCRKIYRDLLDQEEGIQVQHINAMTPSPPHAHNNLSKLVKTMPNMSIVDDKEL